MNVELPSEDNIQLDKVAADCRIMICLLGSFHVLKNGQPVPVRSGGQTQSLLRALALRFRTGVSRETLVEALWPESSDTTLSGQALDSLVYSLQKLLGDGSSARAPVVHVGGWYRLRPEAGIDVDIVRFDTLVRMGEQQTRCGQQALAAISFGRAVALYDGDLDAGSETYAVVERERLRAMHLTALARLADYNFEQGDYSACLDHALQLLHNDPCREDAHRLAMRCYVRRGERAQALRQYRLCLEVLRVEFDAAPEAATVALFDHIRRDLAHI